MNLKEINDKLVEFSNNFQLVSLVNPTNSYVEKRKFLSAYKKGDIYNPQFKYNSLNIDLDALYKKIESLKTKDAILLKVRDNLLKQIKFAKKIGTDDFNDISLYKKPKKSMVEKAKNMISKKKAKKVDRPFSAKAAKEELKACLHKYEISSWEVSISNSMVAKADTNESKKLLKIKNRKYSLDEIRRLEAHEIETHILRAINGSQQKYSLLGSMGMPGYLSTEEGLATIVEEMNNVLSEQTLRFYCARIIAVDMALKKSFYDIFKVMHERYNLSKNNAYLITKRAKRGLTDTSLPRGLIRDHIYFEGREQLKKFIKKGGDIKLLFTGKIGIKDLPLVEQGIIKKPEILPFILREDDITKSS